MVKRPIFRQVLIVFFLNNFGELLFCDGMPGFSYKGPSGAPPFLATTLVGPPDSEEGPPSTQLSNAVFYRENNTELRAQVGSTAVLLCPADHVGDNTVSWIRKRDYHLLTVGLILYSSDQRYQVRFIKQEKDWQLHIRYVQKHDEGVYECQVSSHPPISLMTTLVVVEAKSEILGGPEKFLRTGSSLRLVCVLRKTTQPPSYVFWYLDTRMINYDPQVKVETSGDVSVLFLSNLGPESSGNYSCVPSNAKPSTIHIQILRGGEIPAAIHSSSRRSTLQISLKAFLCLWILFNSLRPSLSSLTLFVIISCGVMLGLKEQLMIFFTSGVAQLFSISNFNLIWEIKYSSATGSYVEGFPPQNYNWLT